MYQEIVNFRRTSIDQKTLIIKCYKCYRNKKGFSEDIMRGLRYNKPKIYKEYDDNKNILRQPQMQLIHYGIFYKGFLVRHRKSSANPMYLTGSGYFSDVLRDSIEYNAYMAEAQLKLKYLAIADWWDMYDTDTLIDEIEEDIEGHPV